MSRKLNRALQIYGDQKVVGTPSITILETDQNNKVRRAQGATVPTDTDAGYSVGCQFVDTSSGVGTTLYVNEGSTTSADFNAVTAGAGGGSTTWDSLYDNDKTLTIDSTTLTFALTHATNDGFTLTGTGSAGDVVKIQNAGTGADISGTSDLWSFSKAGALIAASIADSTTNGTLAVDGNGSGGVDICSVSTGGITLGDDVGLAANKVLTLTGVAATDIIVITDGDILVSDGAVNITDSDEAVGLSVTNDAITTANLVELDSASLTTGSAIEVTVDALTNGFVLRGVTTAAGLGTGGFVSFDDGSERFSVKADGATEIASGVNSTAALTVTGIQTNQDMVTFDNTGGVVASDKAVLLIDAGGAVASGGNLLRIAPTGTPNAGAIGIEYVGAGKTNQALYIDSDPTAAHVVHIHGGGALTNGLAVLALTNDGNLATGGNVFNLTVGGTPNAAAIAAEIVSAKDCQALVVTTSAATNHAVEITGSGAVADNKALLAIADTGTPAAAGSNMVRIDGSGLTDTNKPLLVEIIGTGVDVQGIAVDADSSTGSVAVFSGSGAIADNKAIVEIVGDGTPAAAGSNLLRVDGSGLTDTNKPLLVEIEGGGVDCVGLSIDADPTTLSAAIIHSQGALAADKATLEVVSDVSACNADSSVVRIEQTHTTGVATCLALKQDDVDIPFITLEATIGVGNAIEAAGGKSVTHTHFFMVDVEGVGTLYVGAGTIA